MKILLGALCMALAVVSYAAGKPKQEKTDYERCMAAYASVDHCKQYLPDKGKSIDDTAAALRKLNETVKKGAQPKK